VIFFFNFTVFITFFLIFDNTFNAFISVFFTFFIPNFIPYYSILFLSILYSLFYILADVCLTTTDSAMEDIVRTLLDPFGGSKWLKQAENKGKFNRTEYSMFLFSNIYYLYFDLICKKIVFYFLFSYFFFIFTF
jgi:hypothetical protein